MPSPSGGPQFCKGAKRLQQAILKVHEKMAGIKVPSHCVSILVQQMEQL